ncbi:MAG: type II secretion system GspH family protein [Zoogloeaceae bacterium]|jgi:prepilin-type N-terminal cleavage/methylation domain-containing protein|nr:type II secretion system GspH family protein [Zoogloeaceae bacterium]
MTVARPEFSPRVTGFSLVELAVVMVILGLLLGGMLLPLSAQHDIQRFRAAEAALREIREALLGYAAVHGRLPCPDMAANPATSGYGEAEASCAGATQEGFLPFKTLGLAEHDPWGQRWRYRVDTHFASATPIRLVTTFGDALGIVNNRGESLTASSEEPPVALFFSTGPNARPDGQNASFETTGGLYQADPPQPGFDDQLHWLARPLLFSRLIAAGRAL